MTPPRGLVAATVAALLVCVALYALDPSAWPGRTGLLVECGLLTGNLVLTTVSPGSKRLLVRTLQRLVVNPAARLLMSLGLNPLGLVLLETRGRTSGLPRRTPVGDGRQGDVLWVIAEHGRRAGYVRNLIAEPAVRVRMRVGWRLRWVDGLAEVLPDDDALARQREVVRWHPLRMLNALTVRVLGTDLLTVRIRLSLPSR